MVGAGVSVGAGAAAVGGAGSVGLEDGGTFSVWARPQATSNKAIGKSEKTRFMEGFPQWRATNTPTEDLEVSRS
jgi:hypothetical protein